MGLGEESVDFALERLFGRTASEYRGWGVQISIHIRREDRGNPAWEYKGGTSTIRREASRSFQEDSRVCSAVQPVNTGEGGYAYD